MNTILTTLVVGIALGYAAASYRLNPTFKNKVNAAASWLKAKILS